MTIEDAGKKDKWPIEQIISEIVAETGNADPKAVKDELERRGISAKLKTIKKALNNIGQKEGEDTPNTEGSAKENLRPKGRLEQLLEEMREKAKTATGEVPRETKAALEEIKRRIIDITAKKGKTPEEKVKLEALYEKLKNMFLAWNASAEKMPPTAGRKLPKPPPETPPETGKLAVENQLAARATAPASEPPPPASKTTITEVDMGIPRVIDFDLGSSGPPADEIINIGLEEPPEELLKIDNPAKAYAELNVLKERRPVLEEIVRGYSKKFRDENDINAAQVITSELEHYKKEFVEVEKRIRRLRQNKDVASLEAESAEAENLAPAAEKERFVVPLSEVKNTIKSLLKGKANINKLEITEIAQGLHLQAELDAGLMGGKVSISGTLANSGNEIAVQDLNIEARSLVKSKIESSLAQFPTAIKNYFEKQYGKPISSIQVTGSGLIIETEGPVEKIDSTAEISSVPVETERGEKMEKAKGILERMRSKRLEKARELGEKALDGFAWVGKKWNEIPKEKRLAASVGLAAMALATGGATYALSGLLRVGSAAGLAYTLNKAMEASYVRKTGKERTTTRKAMHIAGGAAVAGLLVILLDEYGKEAVEKLQSWLFDIPTTAEIASVAAPEKAAEATVAASAAETVKESVPLIYGVESDDSLYKILKEHLGEVQEVSGGRQTNLIENILAEIKKDPQAFGVSSGDVNKLAVGDQIDIGKIMDLVNTKTIGGESLLEHAQNLSAEAVSRIENYQPGIAMENPASITDALSSPETVGPTEIAENASALGGEFAGASSEVSSNISEKELLEQAQFKAQIGLKAAIKELYGQDGIFGLFASDGLKVWDDIKNVPVKNLDVFAERGSMPTPTSLSRPDFFGKTVKLVKDLAEAAGLAPNEKETMGNFVGRALTKIHLDNLRNPIAEVVQNIPGAEALEKPLIRHQI